MNMIRKARKMAQRSARVRLLYITATVIANAAFAISLTALLGGTLLAQCIAITYFLGMMMVFDDELEQLMVGVE